MSGRRGFPRTGPSSVAGSVARNEPFHLAFMRTATEARVTAEGVS